MPDLTSWEDERRNIERLLDELCKLTAPLQPATTLQAWRDQFRQQVEVFRKAPTPEIARKAARLARLMIDLAKETPGFDLPSSAFQEVADEIKQGLEDITKRMPYIELFPSAI